jgi:hypothetical protein
MDWFQLRLRKHDGADAGGSSSGGPQFISGEPELRKDLQRASAIAQGTARNPHSKNPEYRARAPAGCDPD